MNIFKLLSNHSDLEWVFIDASPVRAHEHAKVIKNQSISKSIGGNSSKIYLAVDANGNPIQFIIGDVTTHEVKVFPDLIDLLDLESTQTLFSDKGYDSKKLREQIVKEKTNANIPKKLNTKSSNDDMDWYLYEIRGLVENAFERLKQFRGIATRYDKLKRNSENSVALACIFIC